jgi:hypothetical protein
VGAKDNQSPTPAEDIVMMVFDKRIKKNETYLHYGLGIDIELHAPDRDVAAARAEGVVLNFLSLISYIDSCYVEVPSLILSYRTSISDLRLREFQATVMDNAYHPVETFLRPINLDRLNRFIEAMKSAKPEIRQAVDGALHWYWKALGSKNLTDRFLNLWISLEYLEGPLKTFFGLPLGSVTKKPICPECKREFSIDCPHCGENYYYEATMGMSGIKQLEVDIHEDIDKFNRLHRFRSKLFHSAITGPFHSKADCTKAIYSTRVLLNCAILTLLGLDTSDAVPLANVEMRSLSLPMLLEFKGEVTINGTINIDDTEKQPAVHGDYVYKYELDPISGDLLQYPDVVHTFEGAFEAGQVLRTVKIDSSHKVERIWERNPEKDEDKHDHESG